MLGALLLSHANAENSVQGSGFSTQDQTSNIKHQTSFSLPLELFEEANWQACRTECARILLSTDSSNPTSTAAATRLQAQNGVTTPQAHSTCSTTSSLIPKITLMHAVCGLRLGLDSKPELETLCNPQKQNISIHGTAKQSVVQTPLSLTKAPSPQHPVPNMAHYELGRAYWIEGNTSQAFKNLKQAFLASKTIELYQHSGCTLYLLLKENPKLTTKSSGLQTILATCRKEWDRNLFKECRKPKAKMNSIATAPGRWLISFYQTQIGPAIGDRCSLNPSCSRYAREALQTHGLIGAAIMGDRFIREPDVVKYRKNPTKINGHTKYSDPLSDHDWWMK